MPGATIRRVAALPRGVAGRPARGSAHSGKAGPSSLFVMPGTGSFLARDGSTIEFAPEADADDGMITLFLNGTARGALIHQRGELPLHAATLWCRRAGTRRWRFAAAQVRENPPSPRRTQPPWLDAGRG